MIYFGKEKKAIELLSFVCSFLVTTNDNSSILLPVQEETIKNSSIFPTEFK